MRCSSKIGFGLIFCVSPGIRALLCTPGTEATMQFSQEKAVLGKEPKQMQLS